ncbi:carboxyl transferase domain-containing protein [Nocardioides campestrisoli]|uniref:carboxyl transferase domain-containing protein n=1 Tax=Nocardioides campestrisoli TaxID=2736757 RepID=UPI00163DDA71|nr:carboxyl transferase domain-containing protein [Nocardioides campestrisoli]
MKITKLLVANRGEIAVRVMRAASTLDIRTVGVAPADDRDSGHVAHADEVVGLAGSGPAAYLDVEALVRAAVDQGCDAVHPGYGFLSESPEFAERCEAAGIRFVGPTPETLRMFGDKTAARRVARKHGVPLLPGTVGATPLEQAHEFLAGLGEGAQVMVKAVAGGGGRGMLPVSNPLELDSAYERCASEALKAFGSADLYVEQLLVGARHVEVQVLGDGQGGVTHLWDRDCSVQRRRQKLVEVAPAQLPPDVRHSLLEHATSLARAANYRSLGTVEFLVAPDRVAFLEVNPRIQVEHTVTEEVLGLDLVELQLRVAGGATLAELGVEHVTDIEPTRSAMQLRVTTDRLASDGSVRTSSGRLTGFQVPGGPGTRVDTHAHTGMSANPRYDSLLAKVVVSQPGHDLAELAGRGRRALRELVVEGVDTNIELLQAILDHPDFLGGEVDTTFVERRLDELLAATAPAPLFGTREDREGTPSDRADVVVPEGCVGVRAPMAGVVVATGLEAGSAVAPGSTLVVLEAMKMEHVVLAEHGGAVESVHVATGDTVDGGQVVAVLRVDSDSSTQGTQSEELDLDAIRPDLAEVLDRRARTQDGLRPAAVERRRRVGRRTARENVTDLLDEGSFVEYGGLVLAAQRRRLSPEELVERTPADGLVGGIGTVAGHQVVTMAYDYTVLAGTQGFFNHAKMHRLLVTALEQRLPVVLFVEGGGGRPGDTDMAAVAQLDEQTFTAVARLSGQVPLVAIAAGRTFAGNAALAAVSDLIIATRDTNLGMGGPAMIEGGGLGVFAPEEVGPVSVQVPNGVIDVLVEDEAEAVATARTYLRQVLEPVTSDAGAHDQRLLRHVIPENRLRAYDVRRVVELVADVGSVLELRPEYGPGILTCLARVEGRAVGVLANNPRHLGGAIDAPAAEKAARFLQLCDVHRLPVVSLVDTPGFMVGPEAEEVASVRRFGRMFLAGAHARVPMIAVVLRKGYGLGAMAMTGGDLKAPLATVAWPTGEFGGMGLEGYVRLGHRAELEAIEGSDARQARYEELVAELYERGKALSIASVHEVDDVIDPAETRTVVSRLLAAARIPEPTGRRFLDSW